MYGGWQEYTDTDAGTDTDTDEDITFYRVTVIDSSSLITIGSINFSDAEVFSQSIVEYLIESATSKTVSVYYYDEDCTEAFDFSIEVTSDCNLYYVLVDDSVIFDKDYEAKVVGDLDNSDSVQTGDTTDITMINYLF